MTVLDGVASLAVDFRVGGLGEGQGPEVPGAFKASEATQVNKT